MPHSHPLGLGYTIPVGYEMASGQNVKCTNPRAPMQCLLFDKINVHRDCLLPIDPGYFISVLTS